MSRLGDIDDPRIVELRERVKNAKPHVPKPGDPDYQTPEQIARIKKGCGCNNCVYWAEKEE